MTDSDDSYLLDSQVGYLLRLANQRHASIFQSHTLEGLTPTQFAALVRIAELGKCSQNRLGRLAAMDVATIKGVVDRLKQKGFTI
ncbi:MarR family winged helix-turn-helix transcriptional regulator, partial [Roseibium sp. RKSG952]